ncbi:hypothetical protein MNB_SUP05-10-270 [hydrothermal vent metagenome]|jgi:positive regulator of sigma E activity|uniref:Uncharacterized protein n=1 Tax=hydrothermal vent metagenome TaxID=652676 RepID=A0A1W1D798_9ZZZZ
MRQMRQVRRNVATAILLGSALILPTAASAFGFGGFSVPSVPGLGGGSSKSVDAKGLSSRTNSVVSDFAKSLILFNDALGLEVSAEKKEALANCSSSKGCSSDDMDKITSISEGLDDKMSQMKSDGVRLDAESREMFSKGLLPYLTGTVKGVILGKDLVDAGKSDPTSMFGMLDVIAALPKMVSGFSSSTGAITDYATYNGIDVPEVSAAE